MLFLMYLLAWNIQLNKEIQDKNWTYIIIFIPIYLDETYHKDPKIQKLYKK